MQSALKDSNISSFVPHLDKNVSTGVNPYLNNCFVLQSPWVFIRVPMWIILISCVMLLVMSLKYVGLEKDKFVAKGTSLLVSPASLVKKTNRFLLLQDVDSPVITPDDHLIAQVQNIVNTNNIVLNFELANRVTTSIAVDLGRLDNDLSAFPTNNPFELLNLERTMVPFVLEVPSNSIGVDVLDQGKDKALIGSAPLDSNGLPLLQSPLSRTSPFSTPTKRGCKPKHVKTKLEIDAGIQSTLLSPLDSSKKKRSKNPFSLPVTRALASKRILRKEFFRESYLRLLIVKRGESMTPLWANEDYILEC